MEQKKLTVENIQQVTVKQCKESENSVSMSKEGSEKLYLFT